MGSSIRPPAHILRKAWSMGQKMARKEGRTDIDLNNCHQFASYELFRLTNRARMQNLPALAPWEEQLQALVQRCAKGMDSASDSTEAWDAVEQQVARPIYNAFWTAWEQQIDLPGLFQEAANAQKAKRGHTSTTLHVNPHPNEATSAEEMPSSPDEGVGSSPWHQHGRTIFDERVIADDDAFWAITGAHQQSDHTGDESLDNLPKVFGPIRPVPESGEGQPTSAYLEAVPQSGVLAGSLLMWA